MLIQQVKEVINSLYSGVDGYLVSADARRSAGKSDKEYTYGEVLAEEFYDILSTINPRKNENFYDLGSGLGKPTFLASLLFDFKKSTGIEMLSDLCGKANKILEKYKKEVIPTLDLSKKDQEIKFVNSSFLDVDWSDANVIFTHSTCFNYETMAQIAGKLLTLRPGTRIITVTKNLESPFLHLLKQSEHMMNWGKATVYFYEKIL